MDELPVQTGSYALILELVHATSLEVGRLGRFDLLPGIFVYLGSANGLGGLRARLGRHLSGEGRQRWHIDYLRQETVVRGYGILTGVAGEGLDIPIECCWSHQLSSLSMASIPIPKFGASDCQSGCPAHLIYCRIRVSWMKFPRYWHHPEGIWGFSW